MEPIEELEPIEYGCTVTVTFRFNVMAMDDFEAEKLAMEEWQNNLYHSEVNDVHLTWNDEEEEDE